MRTALAALYVILECMPGQLREVVTNLAQKHGFALSGSEYRTLYVANTEGLVLAISVLGVLHELEIAHYYPGEQRTLCPAPSVIFRVEKRKWRIVQIDTWPDLEIRMSQGLIHDSLTALNRLEVVSIIDAAVFLKQFAHVILEQWASVPHTASMKPPTWFPQSERESSPEDFPY
jgi:hypothetical protein